MDQLKFEDQVRLNTIIWLQSLGENETGPSNRMVEDLETLALDDGLAVERITVGTRNEALDALGHIAERSMAGLRPVIHFDCHGSKNDGLAMAPSGEFLDWHALAEALRAINVATENNLCCVFGVCFGFYLSTKLDLLRPSPYYLTIAPMDEVSVSTLEARTGEFYRTLNQTGNITTAYDEVLSPELHLFHCRAVFARTLAFYVADHCLGKAGAARRERLLTNVLREQGIATPTKNQLKQFRGLIKQMVKPTKSLIERFAPTFLIGREPGFGFAELERLAAGARHRHHSSRTKI